MFSSKCHPHHAVFLSNEDYFGRATSSFNAMAVLKKSLTANSAKQQGEKSYDLL